MGTLRAALSLPHVRGLPPQRAVKGQGPFDPSERIPRNEGGEARAAAHGGRPRAAT
nr:MAG TPA: hypothetical protein [Caudoviricetes sp.]